MIAKQWFSASLTVFEGRETWNMRREVNRYWWIKPWIVAEQHRTKCGTMRNRGQAPGVARSLRKSKPLSCRPEWRHNSPKGWYLINTLCIKNYALKKCSFMSFVVLKKHPIFAFSFWLSAPPKAVWLSMIFQKKHQDRFARLYFPIKLK